MHEEHEYATLENISDIRQWITYGDDEDSAVMYELPPYGVLDFPLEVAREFLMRRPQCVRVYEPVKLPEPKDGEPLVYIANMTGSPFLPETVQVALVQRGGKMVDELIPNPLRIPHVVSYTMQGEQIIQPCRHDPSSKESLNMPSRVVSIPPFRRFKLGMTLADWLLRRDAAQIPGLTGALSLVGAPRSYEAQPDWRLYELQAYAVRVDLDTFSRHDPVFGPMMSRHEEDYEDLDELKNVREKLWQALWFRCLDERRGTPTKLEHRQMINTAMRARNLDPKKYKELLDKKRPKAGGVAAKIEGGGKAQA
jgi:hypothetical protein